MANPVSNGAVPAYHADHDAAVEEIGALAALLAGVIQAIHGRAVYLGELESIAESALQHEAVLRQLERLG